MDLLARARDGDGDAFSDLVAPHRRELHLHCYRMLGSFAAADDTLQETLVAAWRGLAAFEGRSSLRTWLYRIATNRCLNTIRDTGRRVEQPGRQATAGGPLAPGGRRSGVVHGRL